MQASKPQSHLRFPLTALFASGGHVRVLRALMTFGGPLSVAQIAADCGLSPRGARLVLDSLVSQSMVRVWGQPRSQLYSVVEQHPLAETIKALFQQERDQWERAQSELRNAFAAQKEVRAAWLYGSVARGEDKPRSDVDVAIVVNENSVDASHRVRDAVQALGDRLRLHLSAVVLTPEELAAIPKEDPWWTDVTRDARVFKGLNPSKEHSRCERAAQTA